MEECIFKKVDIIITRTLKLHIASKMCNWIVFVDNHFGDHFIKQLLSRDFQMVDSAYPHDLNPLFLSLTSHQDHPVLRSIFQPSPSKTQISNLVHLLMIPLPSYLYLLTSFLVFFLSDSVPSLICMFCSAQPFFMDGFLNVFFVMYYF